MAVPSTGPLCGLCSEPTGNLDSKSGDALIQMFGELPTAAAPFASPPTIRWFRESQPTIQLFDGKVVASA